MGAAERCAISRSEAIRFLLRYSGHLAPRRALTIEQAFASKSPGDIDLPVVQDLKRMIRESEALAALRTIGLSADAARFLNLPFYRTGQVRKDPVGADDVRIVLELLDDVQPAYAFVAGDLSDPHGTHRMWRQAIEQALARYTGSAPEVWLYRGAWQEWSVTEADVLVPLSHDEREFWQRVEARNRETATQADRLGLPEYYAMEAYVVQHPSGRGEA